MRVGFRDLTLWSFVMASAHGAGLMLVPIVLAGSQGSNAASVMGSGHVEHMDHFSEHQTAAFADPLGWLAAVGVHSTGHLLAVALIALLVYEKLGLALLSRAWFNLDLIWVIALMISGTLILLV